ncbi:MAG: peptidase M13 [Gemmatimonadota bacterium]|nr:MAG: peptidase M13 [Gemmatimonadota bacterium]
MRFNPTWNRGPAAAVASVAALALAGSAAASEYAPHIGDFGLDLEGQDSAVRPQDDFFRYSNGQWLAEFEIPEDLAGYGSFTKLFLESEEQVKAIIEEVAAADSEPGTVAQKVGDLYNDYVDEEAIEAAGLTPLAADFERVLAAESHTDILRLLGKYDRLGGTTPFNYYIGQDEKDPSRSIIHFVQSGLGLPDRDYYLDDENARFVEARKIYRNYLETLFTLAERGEPAARAEAIYALEARLAEAHWPSEDTRDLDKTYNMMSRKALSELAPGLPWDVYLEALGVQDVQEFVVEEPSAYAAMAQIFTDTPVGVWQDYMIYRLLRNNASLLPKAVDDAHFAFTSQALSGAKEKRERWKRGVQFINSSMGEAVGQLYVERHFSATAKERIDELVNNLLIAFGDRLDRLDWMSDATRAEAKDKLSKFAVKIGYPEEWKDFSTLEVKPGDLLGNTLRARMWFNNYQREKLNKPVDRLEWFLSPQVVNAYYNPGLNEIVFPAAILQPPFFDPYADDAINYGGIGAVIGHEIGHGFDDQGRKVDGDGVMRDWWVEKDAELFGQRADALVEQYNAYEPIEGMFINGELTLGENIGDLGGLEIAYHAYRLSLNGKEAPVIDGLTGDQRFFLGFAQIWRGKYRDEAAAQQIAADPHSPVEFRVNGTLCNIDAFYAAFDVKPGDAMYREPDQRVRIW